MIQAMTRSRSGPPPPPSPPWPASFANGTSPATPPESVDHPLDGAAANKKRKQGFRPATDCVFVSETGVRDPYGASAVPIYQTATFKQSSATDMGEYDYTRSGNPTRSNLESHLAKILKAKRAFATSTGMTALDVITRLVPSGHHIVAGNDLYGGSNRLLAHLARTNNIVVHHVDTTNIDEIRPVLDPTKTALVLLESPTNPCMRIADIRAISDLVHTICSTALVVVDNTMMSPVLMNPLELGADVEYHSATKFLSGHHDLMAGVVAVNNDALADRIAFVVNATGTGLSPFDSFLLLRGVKTLHLRVAAHASPAGSPPAAPDAGYEVLYPTLSSHPQHDLHTSQASGGGAVLSLLTGSVEKSRAIVEATTLWGISVSFGCVNSLISMPCHMSHASIPKEVREARGLREDLVRLCVGIEDTDDLIEDLERALAAAEALHAE
ncbi:cystathionine beta-lyase MetG [Zopfochytrium polystomum]|nr:cystathionine beta-lyase MetG [Zopfochytrium polystomum]